MQKVADRGPVGKPGDPSKVANNGSYARGCAIEHALVWLSWPISLSASASSDGARKNCETGFAPGRWAGERAHSATPGVADSSSRAAGAGSVGRSAAIAPIRDNGRSLAAGSGNRNAVAGPPGGRARATDDRSTRAASRGLLSALRLELLSRNSARHLSALRALARGAS